MKIKVGFIEEKNPEIVLEKEEVNYEEIESLTAEEFLMLTDIKAILAQQNLPLRTPVYGDETDMTFEDWQNEKAAVERKWINLSVEERQKFGTVSNFLEYCSNPANYISKDGVLMYKNLYEEEVNKLKLAKLAELEAKKE